MIGTRKRKTRKKRLTDISLLGLETGKLYEFKGRSRLLYKEQSPTAEWKVSLPKIRNKDHLMFFKADLWECNPLKKKATWAESVDWQVAKLKNSNNKITRVEETHWNRNMRTIHYEHNERLYSGMMYVGFGNKFGWINIVQMSKEDILLQFQKVERKQNDNA